MSNQGFIKHSTQTTGMHSKPALEKKTWQQPKLGQLYLKHTKGGPVVGPGEIDGFTNPGPS